MKTKNKQQGALDVNAAAEYLCVSRATLYRLMATNQVPYVKLGGKRLIRQAVLQRLLSGVSA